MPPKKSWTDDEVQAYLDEQVAIVRDDRDRAAYRTLHERFKDKPDSQGDGKTPPPDKGDPAPGPKKRGLFWGDADV